MGAIWCEAALLPDGWAPAVRLVLDGALIASVERACSPHPTDARCAVALPGIPNLHSHAFQRAMAGRAEAPGPSGDDFWSWRDAMYGLVDVVTPEDVAAIAAMAFVEMIEAGFTRVGEFHYLHHDRDGLPYGEPATMAHAIAAAAMEAGIGLTLLPVFYAHSGFGGAAPTPMQRRFINDIDAFARLHEGCAAAIERLDGAVLGIAPHSLRAVTPEELTDLLVIAPRGPVHIHIAEQIAEVDACRVWSGRRPVEWLLDSAPVDDRWCLVHATHVDTPELAGMIKAGPVVGLCPVTEANLGDGIFPVAAFVDRGGVIGIGSDSNVRIDVAEELRLLEYGQRLSLRRRNVLARSIASTGRALLDRASAGGALALGASEPALSAGAPADIVALAPDREGAAGDELLDSWIFARGSVDAVWRAGRQIVQGGRHINRDAVAERFHRTVGRIRAA